MGDERTLRLAQRPVTPKVLASYLQFVRLELQGQSAVEALCQAGLSADEVARTSSVVNAFCRPRLLKRRLARARAKRPEDQSLREALATTIDDSEFVALYGQETHRLLISQESILVELRAKVVGEG